MAHSTPIRMHALLQILILLFPGFASASSPSQFVDRTGMRHEDCRGNVFHCKTSYECRGPVDKMNIDVEKSQNMLVGNKMRGSKGKSRTGAKRSTCPQFVPIWQYVASASPSLRAAICTRRARRTPPYMQLYATTSTRPLT